MKWPLSGGLFTLMVLVQTQSANAQIPADQNVTKFDPDIVFVCRNASGAPGYFRECGLTCWDSDKMIGYIPKHDQRTGAETRTSAYRAYIGRVEIFNRAATSTNDPRWWMLIVGLPWNPDTGMPVPGAQPSVSTYTHGPNAYCSFNFPAPYIEKFPR